MPQCHLCGSECEHEAKYCAQCGISLNDSGVAQVSPEWAATEEFLDLSKALSSTLDLHLLLRKIDDSAVRLTGGTSGSIMLFDENKTSLHFRSSSGEKASAVRSLPVKDGIAWWTGQNGVAARVDNASESEHFTGAIDKITGFETENLLCVPVTLENDVIGVIEVLNKTDRTGFSEQDEQLLSVLAGQAAVAVKNARLATEQRNFFDHVIEIFVMAMESTLLVPEEHCWKVAKMATAIGRQLKMQEQGLQDLYYAATLHDLGMIKLRERGIVEKNQMESHPILGANMVRGIDMLNGAESIIRHHHEYLDGSGYPDGMVGREIPFGARIIAVVEAYQEAIMDTGSQLIAEIRIEEGCARLFDAVVVDAFLKLIDLG